MGALASLYRDYQHQAQVLLIYIAEAHTVDGWQTASNESEGIRITQPRALSERIATARLTAERLDLPIPILVDDMDDTSSRAFAAWPERLFVVDSRGSLRYCGEKGPYGFRPAEAREALARLCPPGA